MQAFCRRPHSVLQRVSRRHEMGHHRPEPDTFPTILNFFGGRAAGPQASHQGEQPAGAAAWTAHSEEVAGNAQVVGVSPGPQAPRCPCLDLGRDALQGAAAPVAGLPRVVLVLSACFVCQVFVSYLVDIKLASQCCFLVLARAVLSWIKGQARRIELPQHGRRAPT